jgi:hypothetical protein
MTSPLSLGIFDHFGWAVAVTATPDGEVVDRRRIELVEPDLTPAPVHYDAAALDDAALAALIEAVRASVERCADVAFDELAAAVPEPIESIALRRWPEDFPTDLATIRRSPYEARADAVMYRQVLAAVAHRRGWTVDPYDAKVVLDQAAVRLGAAAAEVLDRPRQRFGPPWTKDHRVALAAIVAR